MSAKLHLKHLSQWEDFGQVSNMKIEIADVK